MGESAILLMHCADQQGIVAKVTRHIYENKGNIEELDQYVDRENGVFFMRLQWSLQGFMIDKEHIADWFWNAVGSGLKVNWQLYFTNDIPNMCVFVSKGSHCLFDILSRYEAGEIKAKIPLIISNHETLKPVADQFGIDFHYLPVNSDNKKEQEEKQLALLQSYSVDFIVLARYMQILSENFINSYENKILNIHHSFLPAFPGAKPYHSAYERGVKIIGATSHYVTSDLDAGPIIEQDVVRISHRHAIQELVRRGKDIEKIVLSKAIKLHLERRVLVFNNKTVVFD